MAGGQRGWGTELLFFVRIEDLALLTQRDRRNLRELGRLGWRVLVVWECSLRKPGHAQRRIAKFLERENSP